MTFNVSGNMPAALIHGEILTLPPLPRGDFKTWQATCSRPDVLGRWGASVSKRSLMDWLETGSLTGYFSPLLAP